MLKKQQDLGLLRKVNSRLKEAVIKIFASKNWIRCEATLVQNIYPNYS
jgi:hypothetical protein